MNHRTILLGYSSISYIGNKVYVLPSYNRSYSAPYCGFRHVIL